MNGRPTGEVNMDWTEDDLMVAAILEVQPWAEADIDYPPSEEDWRLLACERNAENAIAVLGAEGLRDHYMVLFDLEPENEDDRILAITHQENRVLIDNPWLGEGQHIRPDMRALCCYDILCVMSELEPGADAVRYRRGEAEQIAGIDPVTNRYMILDWESGAPIDGYTGVRVDSEWREPVSKDFPFSTTYAAESWNAAAELFGQPEREWHDWIASIFFDYEDDEFEDMTFKLLKTLDHTRHSDGLASLGAGPIYGNGHWFYDRIEEDGDIPPENLLIALSMERPEFLSKDVAERYHALMKELKRQQGITERLRRWLGQQ